MSFAVSSKLSAKPYLRGSVTSRRMVAAKVVQGDYAKSLAGITAPFPEGFDPLSLSKTASEKDMKRWRESELHHGRIAMLAALGFLVGEQVQNNPSLDWLGGRITGPAIYHWQQTTSGWQNALILAIGSVEVFRISKGWKTPTDQASFQALEEGYSAGDLGFDPLGLRPADEAGYKEMQSKELNNGRLAMIAVAAIVVQELIYQKDLLTGPGLQAALDAAPLDPKTLKPPPLPIDYPGKGSGLPSLVKPPTAGPGVNSIGDFSFADFKLPTFGGNDSGVTDLTSGGGLKPPNLTSPSQFQNADAPLPNLSDVKSPELRNGSQFQNAEAPLRGLSRGVPRS